MAQHLELWKWDVVGYLNRIDAIIPLVSNVTHCITNCGEERERETGCFISKASIVDHFLKLLDNCNDMLKQFCVLWIFCMQKCGVIWCVYKRRRSVRHRTVYFGVWSVELQSEIVAFTLCPKIPRKYPGLCTTAWMAIKLQVVVRKNVHVVCTYQFHLLQVVVVYKRIVHFHVCMLDKHANSNLRSARVYSITLRYYDWNDCAAGAALVRLQIHHG